ncbi:MAG: TIGR00645 family protein [Bacteroidetes bacterium]|nr:MAG: TIGR00645 family protein [Bacteroidota bacterium]
MSNKLETVFEKIIFGSRWIQAPLYAGLIIGGILYAYKFVVELIHLCLSVNEMTETAMMLSLLTLVDVTMVANLLIMVIIGGYSTFVSRINLDKHEDKPEWLQKINAGTLKVKLSGSLVGVSGIHLLITFINIKTYESQQVMWQVIIHLVFLISSVLLAYSEKLLNAKQS